MQSIYLGQNSWWLLPVLAVSIAVGLFLYSKKGVPWNKSQNAVLLVLRVFAVFLLLFLLLKPEIKQTLIKKIPPTIAIQIDNSESMIARVQNEQELKNAIEKMDAGIRRQGFNTELILLPRADSLRFDQPVSRLSALSDNEEDIMHDKHHVASVLLSDGIYNSGISPAYKNYLKPVFTIGTGDTLPPRDLALSRIRTNKIVFKGNRTPINIEIRQNGYDGETAVVRLKNGTRYIDTKNVKLQSNISEIEFLFFAESAGLEQLNLTILPKEGEFTNENNSQSIFLDIVEAEQTVLLIADAPHPDIKAIRSSLDATGNYKVDLFLQNRSEIPKGKYDLIIIHGAFSFGSNYMPNDARGIWYILHSNSNLHRMRTELPFLNIQQKSNRPDQVAPAVNPAFSKFKIETSGILQELPPVEVPFGEYTLEGPSEVLLNQRVGSLTTTKPLMVFYDDGQNKKAVTVGDGIWRWKLQEIATEGEAAFFDQLVTKTTQFLVTNDKKQKFTTRPLQSTFNASTPIQFNVNLLNDLYENVYGNTVQLEISDKTGNTQRYELINDEFNSTLKIPARQEGIYQYKATTQFGGKQYEDNGEFSVERFNLELQNLTANHKLLKSVAAKSGGTFHTFDRWGQSLDDIKARDFKPLIRSEESYFPLLNNFWYFALIFSMLSAEWFLRKYWGGY